jgi:hypothetical protein
LRRDCACSVVFARFAIEDSAHYSALEFYGVGDVSGVNS